jgi:uncharacterized protein (DUF1778 family)
MLASIVEVPDIRRTSEWRGVMAARPARLELRAGPEHERRIRFAAELSHQSVSTFVLDAAGEKAERVIAASTAPSVLSEFFDQLWETLDAPPQPNEPLRRGASEPRRGPAALGAQRRLRADDRPSPPA